MFSEILRIIPRLSAGDANKMEKSLNQRFTKVGKTFSKTLKNAVKGSVLGLGLAFLAQLLNPLQELEDRLKEMLGKGSDLDETADKFGTTPGQLGRLTNIAASQGVTPDRLMTMLEAFSKAVDTAKTEIEANRLDPTSKISAASSAVSRFVGEEDRAEGLFKFLQSLQAYGKQAGVPARQAVEQSVFGERQYGNARRLLESDLGALINSTKGPTAQDITKGVQKLADLNRMVTARTALNDTENLVKTSQRLNGGIVGQIMERERQQLERERAEIGDYQKLVKAAEAIQGLASIVKEIKGLVFDALGALRDIQKWLNDLLPKLPTLPGAGMLGSFYNAIGLGDSVLMKGKK